MVTSLDRSIQLISWILRIGTFGIFFGHGVYALKVNPKWLQFLEAVGFSSELAIQFMPYIGILDILIALSVIIKPLRSILIWAVFWAFITALMRPIAGGSILDFIERSGNWATPLALLLLLKWKNK